MSPNLDENTNFRSSSTENMYLLISGFKELNCMGFYIPAIYVLL